MNVFDQMTKALEVHFVELDEAYITDMQEWAKARKEALKEFKTSEEYEKYHISDSWGIYEKMFRICGGKTWFLMFNYNNVENMLKEVDKNSKGVITSRNASIAKKLEKVGAKEITGQQFGKTSDGFDGFFVVETDAGTKKISIRTIVAGGYNIQCAHQRTLVKVK